ncbi:MAG: UDP-glucose/GDP-mannose dehydrogenase family protein [Deltaproteobacteria bacterium]|nr:UDP-glucose/GDP-mannose dehydrogenase family protein [Deltaproteobacteria bacterium]
MKVSIIGAGYVGLVTGACLAEKGHEVLCVDKDPGKVGKINDGVSPIYEQDLDELLRRNIGGAFRATTDFQGAILDSEITLIAVGTPFDGKEIDLTQVKEVSAMIGRALRGKVGDHAVVVKSTVVPGTTDEVVLPILEEASGKKAGRDFGVGMNPEFLTEGQAIADFMNPDRIVLGANDDRTMSLLERLYRPFDGAPVLKTNSRTAEMIKYASNAMLATQISFANEFASLCSALGGVDVVDVMKGVHLSNYLRPAGKDGIRVQAPLSSFLEAGCGFGGSCLPKDVNALISHGQKAGSPMPLLTAVIETNRGQFEKVIRLLRKHFPSLAGIRVTVLGLSFKPDTDDMRESPAIPIVRQLAKAGAKVTAHDPVAIPTAREIFDAGEAAFQEDLERAVETAQAIVLVTRWEQYRKVPEMIAETNPQAVFVDGRRMLDKKLFARYEGIGL